MVEFEAVPETDRGEARRILRYAFTPEQGPVTDSADPDGEWPPTLFDQRGLYDGGELVSVCKLYTLDARVRGTLTAVGGLGAVATPPEHRQQGYARALCRHALAEYRERGVGLVALWPFSTPFYRRLGWGTANDVHRYELPPTALPDHDPEGRFITLDADDWERLRRVETAYGEGVTLSVRRSPEWWAERTLADWAGRGRPYCYGYERDGDLRGYVVYSVTADGEQTLSITDIAHADGEAHRALLAFLGRHGAQIDTVVLWRRADTAVSLLDRVSDPATVDCARKAGPMVRLTSVHALEDIDWPDGNLDCTLAVTDPLVEASDGLFRLSVADGTAAVDPVAEDADPGRADATVDVATLSQLAVGTRGVDAAERLPGLAIANESIRDPLSAVFRPRPVCLREFF